jgi:hypothetical protein
MIDLTFKITKSKNKSKPNDWVAEIEESWKEPSDIRWGEGETQKEAIDNYISLMEDQIAEWESFLDGVYAAKEEWENEEDEGKEVKPTRDLYKCLNCEKYFSDLDSLNDHECETEEEVKPNVYSEEIKDANSVG